MPAILRASAPPRPTRTMGGIPKPEEPHDEQCRDAEARLSDPAGELSWPLPSLHLSRALRRGDRRHARRGGGYSQRVAGTPMRGYGGRILFVDLTRGTSRIEPLSENAARALLGGNGLAVGPITDTTVPGNSRACVASKSPLTGLFFDSTFGGRWPATMKRTGFDAIVITGQAPAPVYLKVGEIGAEVKPAGSLWGKTTRETVHAIQAVEGAET